MPSFNDLLSAGKAEYQGVIVLYSHSRYFTVDGIQRADNLFGGGDQNILRDLFGLAECFAFGIECGADPHRSSGS